MENLYIGYDRHRGGYEPVCIGNTEEVTFSETVNAIQEADGIQLSELEIHNRIVIRKIQS